jgi:hypothetical protein
MKVYCIYIYDNRAWKSAGLRRFTKRFAFPCCCELVYINNDEREPRTASPFRQSASRDANHGTGSGCDSGSQTEKNTTFRAQRALFERRPDSLISQNERPLVFTWNVEFCSIVMSMQLHQTQFTSNTKVSNSGLYK